MADQAYPTVKIRPGKGRRFTSGAPWLFADEIAMDRRTRKLEPGTLVTLVEGDAPVGIAAFNPNSRIVARLLDRNPSTLIDQAWLEARLRAAARFRDRLYASPFYRLVHAEGDGLPGVVIDRFGDALVIQPNAAWADRCLPDLLVALRSVCGTPTIVINATARVRALEGLDTHLSTDGPALDGPLEVPMNDALYLADLTGGQKTGLYYDQRPNHAFAQSLARDARVLDVFSHVGGFGLAALAGGASEVRSIDSSEPALALAAEGAKRMGATDRFRTDRADAFAALEGSKGEAYDLVVCDPPAFAPSRDALPQGLRAYERVARLAAPLVAPGGVLCLCSCSHAVGPEPFHKACITGLSKAGRTGAVIHTGRAGADHPVHTGLPEGGYLKSLFFRLD